MRASLLTLLLAPAALAVPVMTVDELDLATFGVGVSQIKLTPGVAVTLLNYSLPPSSKSGVLTHWWMTGEPTSGGYNPDPSKNIVNASIADFTIWSFYVDGESAPSVAVQMSQAALVGGASSEAPYGHDFAGKFSAYGGWHLNVPVPFTRSLVITLTLQPWLPTSGHTAYAMARGVENMLPAVAGVTLPATARLVASVVNASLAVLDLHTLISLPQGTRGMLLGVMIDMLLLGGTLNSLEGCWHLFSPANASWPGQLLGTGGEDYPESAYYFNAGVWRGPTSGLTVFDVQPSLGHVSFYKLHHRDPIFFRDGVKLQWRNGDVNNAGGFKCVAQTGTPLYAPTPANVTSLVWAYTW